MTIKHKNKHYELVELHELGKSTTFDIVGIFETYKDKNNIWQLGEFVNYFFGANNENIKKIVEIAKEYINDFNQAKKRDNNSNAKRLSRVKRIINILCDEQFNFDTCELIEELENLLPFKNKKEHNDWIDLTISFKFFEDWEETTLKIAKRLEN